MKFPLNMVDYNNLIGDASGHILFKSELAEVVRMANAYDALVAGAQLALHFFETPGDFALHEKAEVIQDLAALCAKYPVRGAS